MSIGVGLHRPGGAVPVAPALLVTPATPATPATSATSATETCNF
jgi:hypothetical protein